MRDYIRQERLDAKFADFWQSAHEERDSELPFLHLKIDALHGAMTLELQAQTEAPGSAKKRSKT